MDLIDFDVNTILFKEEEYCNNDYLHNNYIAILLYTQQVTRFTKIV